MTDYRAAYRRNAAIFSRPAAERTVERRPWLGLDMLEPRLLLAAAIDVRGGASQTVVIANNDTTPAIEDFTDFRHLGFSTGSVTRTFKIANTGDTVLNLIGSQIEITGANAADFTVSAGPAASIAAGDSTTFTIQFDPSAEGLRQAAIVLTSDDPTKPTFTFNIQGAGLVTNDLPNGLQIATVVAGTGAAAQAGDDLVVNYTGYLLNGTVFDSSYNPGRYPFRVDNIGTASVIAGWNEGLIGMQVGEHRTLIIPADLAYGDTGQGSIPPGATLIFDVVLHSANSPVSIYGGLDGDELLLDSQSTVAWDNFTNFGNVATGFMLPRTYVIANSGAAAVNLLGTPRVTISGANAADFTVGVAPAATLAAGTTANPTKTPFTIEFRPGGAGMRTAVVTVHTDSPNELDYSFTVVGTGVEGMSYTVDTPGTGNAVAFGDYLLVHYTGRLADGTIFDSSTDGVSFAVSDIGYGNLIAGWNQGLVGMKVGEHRSLTIPPDLGYGATGQGDIPGNATLYFDIELLSVNSQLELRGGTNFGYVVYDGQVTAGGATDAATHVDFGNVPVPRGSVTWKFAIGNFGTSVANFSGSKRVVISGPNAADFKLVSDLPKSIAASGAQGPGVGTFDIKFDPRGTGRRTAVVTIVSEDPAEQDMKFTIYGNGMASDMTLTKIKEDTPTTISFNTLYKLVYGKNPAKDAAAFVVRSVQSGTLLGPDGQPAAPGSTTFGPGQTMVWTPAANAHHTLAAFTVAQWNGTAAVGADFSIRAQVTSVLEAPNGTIADITLRPSDTLRTETIDLSTIFTEVDATGTLLQFDTSVGSFVVNTLSGVATVVDHFMDYVEGNWLDDSIVHGVWGRSMVETGLFKYISPEDGLGWINPNPAIANLTPRTGQSNVRGTLSFRRATWDWNNTGSRYVFNMSDNTHMDTSETAFAEVIRGMNVVEAISRLPKLNLMSYGYPPDFASCPVLNGNWVQIEDVHQITPTITYALSGGTPGGITATLNGSIITVTIPANATGGSTFSVTVTGASGVSETNRFSVNVPVVSVAAGDDVATEYTPGVRGARPDNGTFVISRTGPTTSSLQVHYGMSGTADFGVDYTLSGIATIPAGSSSVVVVVTPIDEADVEADETLTVTITDNPALNYGVSVANSATMTIRDNDKTAVSVAAVAPTVTEQAAGNVGTFRFTRADVTDEPLVVSFRGAGDARLGQDYFLRLAGSADPLTGKTVTIPANQASVDVEVVAIDDVLAEADEVVTLSVLATPRSEYVVGTATAAITILDDEPRVSVAASTPAAGEPNVPGTITFTRTGSTAEPLTVKFRRTGTAKPNSDFVNFFNSVVIPAGASTVDLVVQPLADASAELPELVTVTLSPDRAYSLATDLEDRTATVTIEDGVASATADVQLLSLKYPKKTYSLATLAGQTLVVSGQVRNQGLAVTADPVQVRLLLSQDRESDVGDIVLDTVDLGVLNGGATLSFRHTVNMDAVVGLVARQYFVIGEIVGGSSVLASPLNTIVVTA